MRTSKCFQLLQTLSKVEYNQFGKYLSGMYASYELVNAIYNYAESFHPDYDTTALDWEQVLQTSPFTGMEKKSIQNELSRMYGWLKEFLVWKKMNSDDFCFEREKLEIEVLKERFTYDIVKKRIKTTQSNLSKRKADSSISAQSLELSYLLYFNPFEDKLKIPVTSLQTIQAQLDDYHAEMLYKIGCEYVARQLILQEDNSVHIDFIIEKNDVLNFDSFLAEMYRSVFDLLIALRDANTRQNSKTLYQKASSLLRKNYKNIEKEEVVILISHLLTYLLNAHKLGLYNTLQDNFELIKFGVEKNFLVDEVIPHTNFLNYVYVACRAGAIDWAKQFMEKYIHKVEESHRVDTKNLSFGILYFEQSQWGKVQDALASLDLRNPDFGIRARWLLLACYYEQPRYRKDYDFFMAFCKAFRNYLRRQKKLSEKTIQGSQNLITIVENMVRKNYNTPQDLHQAILASNPLFFQQWLLDKVRTYPQP